MEDLRWDSLSKLLKGGQSPHGQLVLFVGLLAGWQPIEVS